jgi:hypothetical protein
MVIAPIWLPFQDPTLLDYVVSITPYSASAIYTAQDYFTDSAGFNNLVIEKYGRPANEYVAEAMLACMIWMNAIVNAASKNFVDIIESMQRSTMATFMGESSMDVKNRQTMDSLVVQFLSNNNSNVIGPPLAAAATLIYPMPTWHERNFQSQWGSSVEIVGTIFLSLGLLIVAGWSIFLFIHRTHPIIKAASPVFCAFVLIGALLIYVSIATWMPNLISDGMCKARSWILPIGFILMFASMIAKTNRIWKIYSNVYGSPIQPDTAKRATISNTQVFLLVLAIVIIQAIFSVLMVTLVPSERVTKIIDPDRASLDFYACTSSTPLVVLFGLNTGYAGLLLIWGIYLSFRVRQVPLSAYDESKTIGFSIYNAGFFAIIVIVVQIVVGNNNRDATFIVTAICCFLGATITISTLFLSKLLTIYFPSMIKKAAFSSISVYQGPSSHSEGEITPTSASLGESHSNKSAKKSLPPKKRTRAKSLNESMPNITTTTTTVPNTKKSLKSDTSMAAELAELRREVAQLRQCQQQETPPTIPAKEEKPKRAQKSNPNGTKSSFAKEKI